MEPPSSLEGAILLARAERSEEPVKQVVEEVHRLLRAAIDT
jgi:hypothetical protein